WSTGHSEAIVTDTVGAAEAFVHGIGSACVYVNASTRFTDGGEYGMGAEVGNSTQKLHPRGPIGLRQLTRVRRAPARTAACASCPATPTGCAATATSAASRAERGCGSGSSVGRSTRR